MSIVGQSICHEHIFYIFHQSFLVFILFWIKVSKGLSTEYSVSTWRWYQCLLLINEVLKISLLPCILSTPSDFLESFHTKPEQLLVFTFMSVNRYEIENKCTSPIWETYKLTVLKVFTRKYMGCLRDTVIPQYSWTDFDLCNISPTTIQWFVHGIHDILYAYFQ